MVTSTVRGTLNSFRIDFLRVLRAILLHRVKVPVKLNRTRWYRAYGDRCNYEMPTNVAKVSW